MVVAWVNDGLRCASPILRAYREIRDNEVLIRLISARKATKH